jgi:hypothetical protein
MERGRSYFLFSAAGGGWGLAVIVVLSRPAFRPDGMFHSESRHGVGDPGVTAVGSPAALAHFQTLGLLAGQGDVHMVHPVGRAVHRPGGQDRGQFLRPVHSHAQAAPTPVLGPFDV